MRIRTALAVAAIGVILIVVIIPFIYLNIKRFLEQEAMR